MKKFVEVPGSVEGVRLLRPAQVHQEPAPFEKLLALRSSLQSARSEPVAEVEFLASQGDMAFDYVRSLDRQCSASSPDFGLSRLYRRKG